MINFVAQFCALFVSIDSTVPTMASTARWIAGELSRHEDPSTCPFRHFLDDDDDDDAEIEDANENDPGLFAASRSDRVGS